MQRNGTDDLAIGLDDELVLVVTLQVFVEILLPESQRFRLPIAIAEQHQVNVLCQRVQLLEVFALDGAQGHFLTAKHRAIPFSLSVPRSYPVERVKARSQGYSILEREKAVASFLPEDFPNPMLSILLPQL